MGSLWSSLFPSSSFKACCKERDWAEQNKNKKDREKEWERKNCQPPLKKQEKEGWESLQANKKKNCFFSPGCTCRGGNGQLTAHCSHSCPWSPDCTTGLNLATVRRLSGLSVQLLDTSINPAPTLHLPPVVSDHGCQSNFKASSPNDNRGGKKC